MQRPGSTEHEAGEERGGRSSRRASAPGGLGWQVPGTRGQLWKVAPMPVRGPVRGVREPSGNLPHSAPVGIKPIGFSVIPWTCPSS